nr:protein naked cuticle homolog 2 [Oryctolagus cuniculus]
MGALQSRRVEPRARRGEGADPRSLPASSGRAAAASARRESPEGGSFAVSAQASGRRGAEEAERRARDQQELLNGDPEEGPPWESRSPLEVAQTAEKTEGAAPLPRVEDRGGPVAGEGLGRRRLSVRVLRCDVSVEGGSRQEWTLTLYDLDSSGKVTREDVSSLMHTVCEVVNASISHSPDSSKTLHVTLTVSPKPSGEDGPPSGQDAEPGGCGTEAELAQDPGAADRKPSAQGRRPDAQAQACPVRGPCCVDENTERRNHYLDLAGTENYASRFGPGSPPTQARHAPSRSRSQDSDAHDGHAAHACGAWAPDVQPRPKGPEQPPLKPPKGSRRPPEAPGSCKPGKGLGHHLPAPAPQDGHRRYRQRGREGHSPRKATHGHPATVELPPALAGEGHTVPVVQRHEHHHHHHHFHHHHFHPP